MKRIVSLLNDLKSVGVIENYAIGGATALIYYFEPIQTQDVDVFVAVKSESKLINLKPIYDFLKARGAIEKSEYLIIHNTPVQFLIPYNALIEEAITNAIYVDFDDQKVSIFKLEYLMTVMVQTGRMKDKARLEELVRLNINFDQALFALLLERFCLSKQWAELQASFKLL